MLNQQEGERVIFIRGSKDWGICVGKWDGFVKGVFGVFGVKGECGKLGVKGIFGIKGQLGRLIFKFFLLFGI